MNGVAKSRNQLRRMKNKAKKNREATESGRESEAESGMESSYPQSDVEVGFVDAVDVCVASRQTDYQHALRCNSPQSTGGPSSAVDYDLPDLSDPAYAAFADIFQKFQTPEEEGVEEVVSRLIHPMVVLPIHSTDTDRGDLCGEPSG